MIKNTNIINYQEKINKLYQIQEKYSEKENVFFLSAYQTFETNSQSDNQNQEIETKFKSMIEKNLTDFAPKKEQKHLRLKLAKQIANLSKEFNYTYKGVMVNVAFHLGPGYHGGKENSEDDFKKDKLILESQVTPLLLLPSDSNYTLMGKIFSMLPLIENRNKTSNNLIIQIEEKLIKLYSTSQNRVNEIKTIEPSFHKLPETEEYLDERSPDQFGTHSNRKDKNYYQDYILHFIREDLTNQLENLEEYNKIKILIPKKTSQEASNLRKKFEDQNHRVEIMEYIPYEEKNLKMKVIEESKIDHNQDTSENLDSQNIEELPKIVGILRRGKIKELYVSIGFEEKGYISKKDNLVYLSSEVDNLDNQKYKKVNNLRPYLVQEVEKLGGKAKAILFHNLKEENKNKILAKERY